MHYLTWPECVPSIRCIIIESKMFKLGKEDSQDDEMEQGLGTRTGEDLDWSEIKTP